MTNNLRVVVVDDQHAVRAAVAAALSSSRGMAVVGSAGDASAAVTAVRAQRPDIVLMNLRLPHVDGLAAARVIAADPRLSQVHIVVLADSIDDPRLFEALCHGAAGFVIKRYCGTSLVNVVRAAARGAVLPAADAVREVAASALAQTAPDRGALAAVGGLTARERWVISLIAAGWSNREIAGAFGFDPTTMFAYVNHIRRKLDARERMQLAMLAYRARLVTADAEPGPIR